MKRRDLFRLGARNAARIAARLASEKLTGQADNWIRPPFAKAEPEFLSACTRCDECINACGYDVLFSLPDSAGPRAAGTPAMDLLNRGCHMCVDWPCVTACEPNALKLPEDGATPPAAAARLARARIDPKTCLPYSGPECGACAHSCPVPGALHWVGGIKPVINVEICTGCGLCREACITDPNSIEITARAPAAAPAVS
jgi:ferredoxin-type protein NapG